MITEPALAELRTALRGSVLTPGDVGYDATRQIFNAMIDSRPALVARCATAADILACVGFAQAHGLVVSVRGGGHNVSGKAVVNPEMVDVDPLDGDDVDWLRDRVERHVTETESAVGRRLLDDWDAASTRCAARRAPSRG